MCLPKTSILPTLYSSIYPDAIGIIYFSHGFSNRWSRYFFFAGADEQIIGQDKRAFFLCVHDIFISSDQMLTHIFGQTANRTRVISETAVKRMVAVCVVRQMKKHRIGLDEF